MNQQEVWEGIASDWKKSRHKPWKEVTEFLADKKGLILDIGCGSGTNFISGKEYLGVDLSKNMLRYAKEDAKNRKIKAVLSRASASALPVKSDTFETVLYIATLHTIKGAARQRSLAEMRRVMKPGGCAIVTVWNREQPKFAEARKKEAYVPWKHEGKIYLRYYYLYDKKELGSLLEKTGFVVERIFDSENKAFNVFPRNIMAVVRK